MRISTLSIFLALMTTAAMAQPYNGSTPSQTTQCIEAGGHVVPPVCQAPPTKLDHREYICTCPNGGQQVDVAVCARGEKPPPEGKALNIARREGMRDDGSLIGDTTLEGQLICVAPRGR